MKLGSKFIIAAVVLLGVGAVAYAAFAQVLTINGSGTTTGDWDVAITGITQTLGSGATEGAAPTFTGTSATFDVDLAYPGASATYEVTMTNNGTIPAIVTSVDGVTAANAAAPLYITYALSGVDVNTKVAANGGTNKATVVVTWNPADTAGTAATKPATITFNYAQDTP